VFGGSTSLQLNSVSLSHRSSTSLQPPASQQYFSLTPLQHQPPAPAQQTEWLWFSKRNDEQAMICMTAAAPAAGFD